MQTSGSLNSGAPGDSGTKLEVGINSSLLLFVQMEGSREAPYSRTSLLRRRRDNESGSESIQPGRYEQRHGLRIERRAKWH